MLNSPIPPMPHATVDTRLDAPQALMLAEEAIGRPIPLMSAFNLSKIGGEVTGRHPTGFTYKTSIVSFMGLKLNEGYVVAQENGQGGTRISFHENKRSTMIYGIMLAGIIVFELLFYFLAVRQSAPAPMQMQMPMQPMQPGFGYPPPAAASGFPLWLFIIFALLAIGVTAFQMYEVTNAPKKVVQYFSLRANGGMPAPQASPFPGQPGGFAPQPGFPPPQHAGFPPQQPASFPPHQAGFAPAAQPTPFPQQADPGFAPAPMPQAAPAAAPAPETDAAEKLRQLAELRDTGVITAADYDQAAAAIQGKA